MAELLKKITVNTVLRTAKGEKKVFTEAKTVARFIGIATGAKVMQTVYGESVRFLGQFKGINAETGEEFHATYLFLPGIAEGVLFNALNTAQGAPVNFALDIGVKPDASTATGYVFTCVPLLENGNDPLAAIQNSLPPLKALPEAESKPKK